jgi:hypothetical protein
LIGKEINQIPYQHKTLCIGLLENKVLEMSG